MHISQCLIHIDIYIDGCILMHIVSTSYGCTVICGLVEDV